MSRPKLLFIQAVMIVIFGAVSFYVVKLPTDALTAQNATILQNIFSSICASFIFLLTLNTGFHLQNFYNKKMFRAFFGELSICKTSNLVYPDFILSDACCKMLSGLQQTTIFSKPTRQYPGTRFIDVPKIVASNDLQALLIVASQMGKYLGDSPNLLTDEHIVNDHTKSLISFGLTSNFVTELYLHSDLNPLFKIEDQGDNPTIVVTENGEEKRYGRDDNYQHGIILRYRPSPDDYPNRYWIICAGLAAAGTHAAAYTFAHKWEKYSRRFGKKDFLIILKSSNDIYAMTSATEINAISR